MGNFFKAKTDKKAIEEQSGGGGKYIGKSGIYDVEVIVPMVSTSKTDVTTVDFFINYNGQQQPLYGNLRLNNKDGSESFSAHLFNKFCIIAGIEDVEDPVEADLPIGKKGADKTVSVLEDLADITCKVRVQMEYAVYNGNITEKTIIKGFYNEAGSSAEEVVNDAKHGEQLEKDLPYAENVTYKDGTTAEGIAQWIKDKRPKGTAGAATTGGTSAGTVAAKKKPSFGKK